MDGRHCGSPGAKVESKKALSSGVMMCVACFDVELGAIPSVFLMREL